MNKSVVHFKEQEQLALQLSPSLLPDDKQSLDLKTSGFHKECRIKMPDSDRTKEAKLGGTYNDLKKICLLPLIIWGRKLLIPYVICDWMGLPHCGILVPSEREPG